MDDFYTLFLSLAVLKACLQSIRRASPALLPRLSSPGRSMEVTLTGARCLAPLDQARVLPRHRHRFAVAASLPAVPILQTGTFVITQQIPASLGTEAATAAETIPSLQGFPDTSIKIREPEGNKIHGWNSPTHTQISAHIF